MSVLSMQCEHLRLMAQMIRKCGYVEIGHMMDDAADTIWNLRDQNLKLHDQVDELEEQRDHTRDVIETLWPRAAFTMRETCKATWIAELGELGIEVTDTETIEY